MGATQIPEQYAVLSREEVARRLRLRPSSLATYLARRAYSKVPAPDGRVGRSPYWYEVTVREWELQRSRARSERGG